MIRLALRDLQFHWRRTAIAVVAIGVLLGISLTLAGVNAAWGAGSDKTLATIGGDFYLVPAGSSGPFDGPATFPAATAAAIARMPGVTAAEAILTLHDTLATSSGRVIDTNVVGYVPGSLTRPHPTKGNLPSGPGQVLVDAGTGLSPGDKVTLGPLVLTVSGVVSGVTYFAGQPVTLMALGDAQRALLAGRDLASAVVVQGVPRTLPPGTALLDLAQIRQDINRPVGKATGTVAAIGALLLVAALGVIAMIAYMSAIERTVEMTVIKALGGSTWALARQLVLASVLVTAPASVVATVLAIVLRPLFPMPVEVPGVDYLLQPAVALALGVIAGLIVVRQASRVDPAAAFGAGR